MKTQQYLTPSQVEELNKLGIKFKYTAMVWIDTFGASCICSSSLYTSKPTTLIPSAALREDEWRFNGDATPAPSLQEVMEKLPQQPILSDNYNNKIKCRLQIESVGELPPYQTRVGYVYYTYYEANSIVEIFDDNPLHAAYELLKWVAKKHPKTLTNKTE